MQDLLEGVLTKQQLDNQTRNRWKGPIILSSSLAYARLLAISNRFNDWDQ